MMGGTSSPRLGSPCCQAIYQMKFTSVTQLFSVPCNEGIVVLVCDVVVPWGNGLFFHDGQDP